MADGLGLREATVGERPLDSRGDIIGPDTGRQAVGEQGGEETEGGVHHSAPSASPSAQPWQRVSEAKAVETSMSGSVEASPQTRHSKAGVVVITPIIDEGCQEVNPYFSGSVTGVPLTTTS